MDKDKMMGKGKEAMGTAREKVGDVSDDKEMESRGEEQKLEGKGQSAWGDIKDKAGDLKEKFT